ncbi:DUF5983 family protein [Edwardsiella piscicida]|uniref:DUF5983 family protein n=1 Tax=Edwardsiella piscicida TaxID=1263550 RepID=UPI002A6442F6|nr:hypothetical protein [Edwardsiella piscicida]
MKKITEGAPYGVTVIQLENCDEALYLHGNCLASADFSERDDLVCDICVHLADTLGVPYKLLTLPVPDDEEWSWNDVVESQGWGKTITLGGSMIRSVFECSTSHITLADSHLLGDLNTSTREWIHDTGVGFLIRLDAVRFPLLKLKMEGLSDAARWVIWHGIKQANISMIYFSSVGDSLDGFQTFDW